MKELHWMNFSNDTESEVILESDLNVVQIERHVNYEDIMPDWDFILPDMEIEEKFYRSEQNVVLIIRIRSTQITSTQMKTLYKNLREKGYLKTSR